MAVLIISIVSMIGSTGASSCVVLKCMHASFYISRVVLSLAALNPKPPSVSAVVLGFRSLGFYEAPLAARRSNCSSWLC